MKLSAQIVDMFEVKGWSLVRETHAQYLFERKLSILDNEHYLKFSISPDVGKCHLSTYLSHCPEINNLLKDLRREAPFFLHEDEFEEMCRKMIDEIDLILNLSPCAVE